MAWIVKADAPPATGRGTGWDFREGFFPRKTHLKVDALAYKAEAERKGGTNVKVEKAGG